MIWAAVVLAAFGLYLFDNNSGTRAILFTVILVPLLSALALVLFRPRLTASLEVPDTLERGESEPCTLVLENVGHLPVVWVDCTAEIENLLTGERGTVQLSVGLAARETARTPIRLVVEHCGTLILRVSALRVRDLFGLGALTLPCEAQSRTVCPPSYRAVKVEFSRDEISEDTRSYSTRQAGNDPSETFQIRDYAPGDPIRRIHWKLTEKLDKPLVRDFGLPREARVLLTLEEADVTWEDTDRALDTLFSVGLALYAQQLPCTVRWPSADGEGSRTLFEPEDWDRFQDQLLSTRLPPVRLRMDGVETAAE